MEEKNIPKSVISKISFSKNLYFVSKILFYHLSVLQNLIYLKRSSDKEFSLNEEEEIGEGLKWKVDQDIESIKNNETGDCLIS